MTVDELCELVEALTADVTIPDLMAGLNSEVLVKLTPEQFVLLVRFLGGERPVTRVDHHVVQSNGFPFLGETRVYGDAPLDGEEPAPEPSAPARNVLVERGPNGQAILGGEFAGIELP